MTGYTIPSSGVRVRQPLRCLPAHPATIVVHAARETATLPPSSERVSSFDSRLPAHEGVRLVAVPSGTSCGGSAIVQASHVDALEAPGEADWQLLSAANEDPGRFGQAPDGRGPIPEPAGAPCRRPSSP